MTKADDKKIAALAKKNAAKSAEQQEKKRRKQYDDTLPDEALEDQEAGRLFREMKKREW